MGFLKDPRFWKAVAFILVLAVALWIPKVDTEYVKSTAWFVSDEDLKKIDVTSGVRAAFYAMVAAAFVLVSLIPTDIKLNANAAFSLVAQIAGGGAAFFSGWYWLASATGDMPLPYIFPMAALAIVVGTGILGQVSVLAVDNLRRRKRTDEAVSDKLSRYRIDA